MRALRQSWRKRSFQGALLGTALFLAFAAQRAELVAPQPSRLLLDAQERFLAELPDPSNKETDGLGYWPVEEVPKRVAAATRAIEDQHFDLHPGVDPSAILRAVLQNIRSGERISGASTLAMQIARMQRPGARTYRRKLLEATAAVMITARYGRQAVLSHYLRIAPYGNRIRGIRYAARRYLDKPVEDLSWAEIAFLAAIPQSPARMNPYRYRGYRRAIRRGQRILKLLLAREAITREDYALARKQLEALPMPVRPTRPPEALHAIMRVARRAKGGPLIVRASIELQVQRAVFEIADAALHRWRYRGAQNGAVMVIDRQTSKVRAYVGSTGYFDEARGGAIDYAQTPRHSGSTLKPLLYAAALDQGLITPGTILDDLQRARGAISNADRGFLGPLLPRVALGNSRNVPAVRLLDRVGIHAVYDLFERAGLHQRSAPVERYGSGLVVGLLPVRLEALMQAYTALAGNGEVRPLRFLKDEKPARGARLFSEGTARQLTLFLSDPLARLPTFKRMGAAEYPFPVALKTGTSKGYRDAWTVAYTQRYLVGVWIGRPDATGMSRFGGSSASWLVNGIIRHLHRDQLDGFHDLNFEAPKDYAKVKICTLSGQRATEACEHSFGEYFKSGDEPHEDCGVHVRMAVDGRTEQPISSGMSVPPNWVKHKTFHRLHPRYTAWAKRNRLSLMPRLSHLALREPHAAPVVTKPDDGARLLINPEVPKAQATMALRASAGPEVQQLVWYVDGAPFQVVEAPFVARWPLQPGAHTFEVRVPYSKARSNPVRVVVR